MKNRDSSNPYNTNKLKHHPQVIENLQNKKNDTLIQVHLMPQNACNQNCEFCSYRMSQNKNSEAFKKGSSLSIEIIQKLISDMKSIGVKAVEVTGGGEPLLHKNKYKMFELLFEAGFDVALVTNGTLLDDQMAELLAPNLTWMRISLDAALKETYKSLRRSKDDHFEKAVDAFRKIRKYGPHKKEFKFGAGYVMANGNELEAYDVCSLVKDAGADNIRLSLTFSDQHINYFKDQQKLKQGMVLAEKAVKELSDDSFKVINLIPERFNNIKDYKNDYPKCYTKDVLCVIEGSGDVYTCCTYTGSSKGKIGNIIENHRGLKGVWKDSFKFRKELDPRKYCQVTCLYAKRNIQMIDIIDNHSCVSQGEVPLHVNFI